MAMTMTKQERSNSNWEGMLKRWRVDQRSHHSVSSYECVYDHPLLSDGSAAAPQWRGSTQKLYMIEDAPKYYYICDRVYDITGGFAILYYMYNNYQDKKEDEEDEYELERKQSLLDDLDELQAYAEFTDVASVLHSEDCLYSFIRNVLSSKYADIRAKMAEVIITMVQNYPTSQRLLIKEKVLLLLLNNFTSDPDATSRTKALGAISSLIRNKKSGITAFRREKGYASLRKALISGSVCHREVVNLIEYLLRENNLYFQELNLSSCDDAEVRGSALKGLLVLARRKGRKCGRQFNFHFSTCSCSYHRLKQFKLHLHTVKKRKEKKKKQFKLEENEAPFAATPVQWNSSTTSNNGSQIHPSVSLR